MKQYQHGLALQCSAIEQTFYLPEGYDAEDQIMVLWFAGASVVRRHFHLWCFVIVGAVPPLTQLLTLLDGRFIHSFDGVMAEQELNLGT